MRKLRRYSETSTSSYQLNTESEINHDSRARKYALQSKIVKLLHPNTKFRLFWEALIFLVIWYNSIVTPIRLFILNVESTPAALIFIDIALDVVFVIDVILLFFRPHIDNETGRLVTNLQQIRMKCLSSGTFYLNLIACTPILKGPLSLMLDEETNLTLSTNSNILRMIRIVHFPSQFNDFKNYLSQNGPVNDAVFRMAVILFFTQLFMCILGSVYFGSAAATVDDICPDNEDFVDGFLEEELWVAGDSVITNVMDPRVCSIEDEISCDECPQPLFFVRSVYFLMQTLFTIGYGDSVVPSRSVVEIVLVCFFMIFGVFGFGLIIANMTSVLSNIDVVNMRFRHEMDEINKWLTLRSVPSQLRERVESYFSYVYRTQKGMLDHTLFADLPPQLKKEFQHLSIDHLTKIPFFKLKYRNMAFITKILSALIRKVYPPGSYILYEGEKQREMIIIKSGRANLCVRNSSDSVGTLVVGDYHGDYQLLFDTVNQVGVHAPEFVEVLSLTFQNFERVMDNQSDVEFRSLGGNFRQSNDHGATETIEVSKMFLNKIAKNVKNISDKSKHKKLQSMMEMDINKRTRMCILPSSPIHVYWDIFCLLATLYYATCNPIRFALFFRSETLKIAFDSTFLLDYIIDALFVLDSVLRMQVYAYIDFENGRNEVITERSMMKKNYIQSKWFKIDLIAILPFDVLALLFGHYTLFRLFKLVRVFQIASVVKRFQRNLDTCMGVSMTESQSSGLIMLLYSILIVVWSSAGWNALRKDERIYKSVYWALTTLTTVGYGDFTPVDFRETCYAIAVGAIGATFTAGIIANVTSYFHDVDIAEDNIDHKMNCVKCYMDNHACSLEQTKRIQEYFDIIQREQEGLNEEKMLKKSVPEHLRNSLLIHFTQTMVSNCSLFEHCEAGFLRKLMTSLEQQFYGSLHMVLTSSMPTHGMYFIKKGIVELMTKTIPGERKTLKKLEADDNFAEECLFEHWDQNPYLAITITESELWFLSRTTFNRIVEDFPRVRALIRTISKGENLGSRRQSIHYIAKAVERAKRKRTHYIYPDHIFIQFWFGLILTIILYNVIALPLRVAFMENHDIHRIWLILDYFFDLILIIDVFIRASMLAYYDDNHLMVNHGEIWRHYLESGNMKYHLIAMLPMELLLVFAPWNLCPLWKLQSYSLFRLNKLFRLFEMGYLINRVEASLIKIGFRVPRNGIRVGKLLAVIMMSAHFVACLFFMLANFNQHLNAPGSQTNWANDEGLLLPAPTCPGEPVERSSVINQYVTALYFSMATLTTVGYGDITAHQDSIYEISFATLILVIGTAIYTLVIALLEDIVSQLDVTSSLHKMRMDKVNTFVNLQGLPDSIKSKIDAYYENLWKTQRGVNGTQILGFLPHSFRTEMTMNMLSPLLHKTFFIKDCTPDFVAQLLDYLSFDICLPDDTIFHEGQRCDALIFLHKGQVDLLTSKGVKFKTISDCVIGEASFFALEPHLCTGKAADKCELYFLKMENFVTSLHNNRLMEQYVQYLLQNESALKDSKAATVKMINNLKSSKMEKMMVNNNDNSIPRGIILPGSIAREVWETIALILTLLFTFLIPYQISYSHGIRNMNIQDSGISSARFVIDLCMDMFFILDFYARLRKFAVMKEGYLLIDPREFREVYFANEFRADLLSILPVSSVGFLMNVNDESYGLMRLFQLSRVRRFGKYFDSFVETCKSRVHVHVSPALIRVIQIFFIVLFLCHWIACMYHYIGSTTQEINWLASDGSKNDSMQLRYLRSFYWSLYTVTTIGYGSIPVVTNAERIYAMFVMAAGAVICDAGITAILTSIISMRDQQAGTNTRRIQCSKRYMKMNMINKDLQERVLSFYEYTDVELENIDEDEILSNLSSNLRNEVIHHFCFDPLRASNLTTDMSDGAVRTLVDMMSPYLAIPGETLIDMDEECNSIFVLKSGMMNSRDSSGYESLLALGSVVGHFDSFLKSSALGMLTKVLQVTLVSAQGLKAKIGNPYLVLKVGPHSCRSSVKKTRNWDEEILLKMNSNSEQTLTIIVKVWQKQYSHATIGTASITFNENQSQEQNLVVNDGQGRSVGILRLKLNYRDITENELPTHGKYTSIAKGYCHLYEIPVTKYTQFKHYLDSSKQPSLEDRLSGPFVEIPQHDLMISDKDRIKTCWRRPSRPSLITPTPKKSSLIINRKTFDQNLTSATTKEFDVDKKIISEDDENQRKKNAVFDVFSSGKFATIHPENSATIEDEENGPKKYSKDEPAWRGSNLVKTSSFLQQGIESSTEDLDQDYSKLIEQMSESEKQWDVLVDLNKNGAAATNKFSSRRTSLLVEW